MSRQKPNNKTDIMETGRQAHSAIGDDLLLARKIQVAMVPQRMPAVEGLELASLFLPSGAVGGDLFDVIQLTEDVLGLVIFEVAGHGVSAALISAMAKSSFSNHIRSVNSPRAVMERVNGEMIRNISTDYFLTALVAYLDMHDNKLTYCNTGHTCPILFKRKERAVLPLPSTGVFVGMSEKGSYDEKSVHCNPGDWLFLFTGGIYRMFKSENELQSRKLLEKELLKLTTDGSPESFVASLQKRYDRLNLDNEMDDDITAVVVEFLTQSRKSQIREKLGFKSDDPVYLQFISYFEEMDRAAAIILSSMDSLGYPDESIRKMKIILTELFANAIYHGNKGDHSKKVTIGHIINKKKTLVSIMDEGYGFDPKTIPDPTLPENLIKDCGRGLYIVRSYVDKLEFNAKGNRVTVAKNYNSN